MADVDIDAAKRRNRLFLVIALVIAGAAFAAITIGGIGKNLVYYWGPTQVHEAGSKAYGATIRLGGLVAPNSVKMGNGSSLEFDVIDGKQRVHVASSGVPPQMFREGIGVVVEGTMTSGGVFRSSRLMVSHNNEYRAPKNGQKVDVKKLIESTEGMSKKK